VEAVKPTYRLALLTALSFLLVAPLPLQLHLEHPERSLEMYLTPHRSSAMAMFGFVYLWYLMAIPVLEIWLDYRRDIVLLGRSSRGWLRVIYKMMALGPDNSSLHLDERIGWVTFPAAGSGGSRRRSRLLVVAAAILYAAEWLVFAVRLRAKDAVAGAAYGITAALIFAPLLWDAMVRFDVLPAPAAAGIPTGAVAPVFSRAWPGNPGAISSVTTS